MIPTLCFTVLGAAWAQDATPDGPVDGPDPVPFEDAEPPPPPSTCPASFPWPGTELPTALVASDVPAVAALDAYAFSPDVDRADPERLGVRTDGLMVLHHGVVIYEHYGAGFGPDNRHLAWSASKTFTNALVGIAVRDGLLSVDDSICDHIQVPNPESCAVTVRDLLEMASGWDWAETYEGESPTASSVLAMLYGEGHHDMASFVAGHPLRDKPGSTWMYSSGDTNVLSAVVGAALAPRYGDLFPWAVLLDPIGAHGVTWERDGVGTYVGSSYVYATPRDMARFGLLLQADGCWQGDRILPDGWVKDSTTVSRAIRSGRREWSAGDVQGWLIWLNQPIPEVDPDALPWPHVPDDAYAALGHWKQSITVIPSRDMVVVRTADDRDGSYSHDRMLSLALALVDEEAP